MADTGRLSFPYMFWAHAESFRSPYCLAQSGMPLPAAEWLALDASEVLAHPALEAQPALEARLAELFGISPARVLVTLGASGAQHLCAARWFAAENRVALEHPSYEALRAHAGRSRARVFELPRELEAGWTLDPERLAALADAHSTPLHLVLTNPHNPSGAVLDAATLRALASALEPSGGVLLCNEAYMEYAPPSQRLHAATLAPNAVSIGTLTKAYGLGPLRLGWLLFGEGLESERERLLDLAYLTWLEPPTASLVLARRALDHLPDLLRPVRRIEATSRPHLVRWLRESQAVEAHVPPFGILSFPRVRGVRDTRALQQMLAQEFEVDVVAGEHFGAPGYLRVSCGVPEATLVEGLVRLEDGLRTYLERGGS
ncbi:MAG: pyridoxal phosphate-dependent aminotransferase [Planctomycetota bacterium]